MQVIPLEHLRPGESGRVSDIAGESTLVHRLNEMGLSHGSLVRMVRCGSPCIIAIGEQRMTFRQETASILVEPA